MIVELYEVYGSHTIHVDSLPMRPLHDKISSRRSSKNVSNKSYRLYCACNAYILGLRLTR
mgnify:CR=1 FL=1